MDGSTNGDGPWGRPVTLALAGVAGLALVAFVAASRSGTRIPASPHGSPGSPTTGDTLALTFHGDDRVEESLARGRLSGGTVSRSG